MPTTHGTHTALSSTASWPSGQRQADAPAVENLSAAHGTQVSSLAAPVAMEYLPAAHSTHVLESAAYCPAAHTTGAGVVVGSGVVVVGSAVVVVGSGVVVVVVGSGVVVVGSVVVVVGSGVVVVGSGVVVVDCGVVVVAGVAYWPAGHVLDAGVVVDVVSAGVVLVLV